jgi:hypothetical protein
VSDQPRLKLYDLDRDALKQFSGELQETLAANDAERLGELLELGGSLRERLAGEAQLIDAFLRGEGSTDDAPLFASLRRVSKKRALTVAFQSDSGALEGRLRGFDLLREDRELAKAIDKLLSPKRLPWYLRRPRATCGWLDAEGRALLESKLTRLKPSLTPELRAFADAIAEIDGDVVAHDSL